MNKIKWFKISKIILDIAICISLIINCTLYRTFPSTGESTHQSYFLASVIATCIFLAVRIILSTSKKRVLCNYLTKQLIERFKQDGAKRFCINCSVEEDSRIIKLYVLVSGDVPSIFDEEYNIYLQKCAEQLIAYIKKPIICSLDFGEWSAVNSQY